MRVLPSTVPAERAPAGAMPGPTISAGSAAGNQREASPSWFRPSLDIRTTSVPGAPTDASTRLSSATPARQSPVVPGRSVRPPATRTSEIVSRPL